MVFLSLSTFSTLKAQNGSIQGTVIDIKTKETIVGANVLIKGTTKGASTYFDVPSGSTVWASASDARRWYLTSSRRNDTLVANADLNISDPFNLNAPNFLPLAASAMLFGSIWDNTSANSITKLKNEIKLYPNPTNGNSSIEISVSKTEKIQINILDMSGKLISTVANEVVQEGIYSKQLQTQELANGLYMIQLITNENVTLYKFMKQ